MPDNLSETFQSIGLLLGLMLPIGALLLLCLIALPVLLRQSAPVHELIRAIFYCLIQSFGIILMVTGGLPALHSVLAGAQIAPEMYLSFLFVFVIGGLVFLRMDSKLSTVSNEAALLPKLLFFYAWKCIGFLVTILTGISMILQALLLKTGMGDGLQLLHLTILTYGLIVLWFTYERSTKKAKPLKKIMPLWHQHMKK